jgi:hypothetical protein
MSIGFGMCCWHLLYKSFLLAFRKSSCISTAECPAPEAGRNFLHGGMSKYKMFRHKQGSFSTSRTVVLVTVHIPDPLVSHCTLPSRVS